MIDNIISATGYTFLTALVAFYYWEQGKKRGVQETCAVFNEHEPAALERLKTKLKEILNVNTTNA